MNPEQPIATASTVGLGASLAQTAGALMLVLAVIFALAWLLRRVQGLRLSAGAALLQHGGLQLGPKERVIWIQAGDTHLLVGVAPGRVQTLHVFDTPPAQIEAAPAGTPVAPKFAEILRRALGREAAP